MGVVNDKLFLDMDDIVCIDSALLALRVGLIQDKPEDWEQLYKQCEVTQKKIRSVYSELFGNDDK